MANVVRCEHVPTDHLERSDVRGGAQRRLAEGPSRLPPLAWLLLRAPPAHRHTVETSQQFSSSCSSSRAGQLLVAGPGPIFRQSDSDGSPRRRRSQTYWSWHDANRRYVRENRLRSPRMNGYRPCHASSSLVGAAAVVLPRTFHEPTRRRVGNGEWLSHLGSPGPSRGGPTSRSIGETPISA